MKICQNIDLVQLNVQSNLNQANSHGLTYYFPRSVSWAGKKVDKIVVAAPKTYVTGEATEIHNYEYLLSPTSGLQIYGQTDYMQSVALPQQAGTQQQGIYFDFYKKDGSVLAKDLSVLSLLSSNNNVFEINAELDLTQSCIYIPGTLVNSGTIWLYVFYGGKDKPDADYPVNNITVQVPLDAHQRLSFRDIVNTYVHIQPNMIRGIYVYDINTPNSGTQQILEAGSDSAIAITLRDYNRSYIVNNVLDCVIGMPGKAGLSEVSAPKREHLYFDHDIDFDNSFIENLYQNLKTTATIIFEY